MIHLRLFGLSLSVMLASGCASINQQREMQVVGHQRIQHGTSSEAEAQYALGKYHLGENRPGRAMIAFTRAVTIDPRHVESYNGRAMALAEMGDLDRADEDLVRALEIAPESAHLLNNRGYLKMRRGDYQGAASLLQAALTLEPRNPKALLNWKTLAAHSNAASKPVPSPGGTGTVGPGGVTSLRPPIASPQVVGALSSEVSESVINIDPAERLGTRPMWVSHGKRPNPASPAAPSPLGTNAQPRHQSVVTIVSREPDVPLANAVGASMLSRSVGRGEVAASEAAADRLQSAQTPVEEMRPAPGPRSAPEQLEILNGNGVRGMAAALASSLRAQDYRVSRVGNAERYSYGRTRIYFRDGYMRHALELSRSLPVRPAIMLDNSMSDEVHLRLVVGRDLVQPGAARQLAGAGETGEIAGSGLSPEQGT